MVRETKHRETFDLKNYGLDVSQFCILQKQNKGKLFYWTLYELKWEN